MSEHHDLDARLAVVEREAKAAAWDEGFSQGWSDAQEAHDVRQEMDQGDWSLCTPNPYRAALATGTTNQQEGKQ